MHKRAWQRRVWGVSRKAYTRAYASRVWGVSRMSVSEPEDVADHAHHSEGARVVGAAEQPVLGDRQTEVEGGESMWPMEGERMFARFQLLMVKTL
eukprot:3917192-Pleurochrysis_carterae.AAC.1